MGCQNFAGMYGPPTNRQEAVRIIRAAYDRGVTFFDVAEVYGPFLGEEITGEALAPMRDRVVIATKFGFDITPEGKVQGVTSRPDRIKRVTEESLLKLIGDAVLAIFPTSCEHDRMAACRKALAAAQEFCQRAEAENVLRRSSGTPPLAHSLALHVGEVAYGSVGAPHRLDFTVIGPAVNRASRLLDLAKRLDQQVLVSHAVARELDQPLVDLGRHQLRDVEKPQRVFTLLKQGSVRSHRSTRQATS